MSDALPSRRSLESLKKEAKRWLDALQSGDAAARERLTRALGESPPNPTLRDVQHALARENGFEGWTALKDAIDLAADDAKRAGARALSRYETAANALLEAYRTGTPEAMENHYAHTWHRRPWQGMRTYVQLDLGKRPAHKDADVEITVDDARLLVANEHGFSTWSALREFTESSRPGPRVVAKPMRLVHEKGEEDYETIVSSRDWDEILRALEKQPTVRLRAEGQMTDELMPDLARLEGVTQLDLSGSNAFGDDGVRHLATLPRLEYLSLYGTAITDRGLEVLRHLPSLKTLDLGMTRVTDAGMAQLAHCHELEEVNLSWTHTGDGALRALAGKPKLRDFRSGAFITDAGLPLLHEFPVFKTWHGGETKMALLSYRSAPNRLLLRGSLTAHGMQAMRGLDGLFGLNLDDSALGLTAAAMEPLTTLPRLGWLAADAKDDWMPYIAAMPRLQFLGAQDTPAGDDGFVALSKSRSIEYIWGRRCHNLRTRGFKALANIPTLRGLSVSCLNVDDDGVAALPSFPALRELMPMDVPDAGYRHIGQCKELDSLVLMYCRDTTDAATEHITGLSNLKYYFNSYTTITDRTPQLLSVMDSLERITFDACHNLTNDGVAKLARLPRLRQLRVAGRQITDDVESAFPRSVSVHAGG
jgi:hypothetical protein